MDASVYFEGDHPLVRPISHVTEQLTPSRLGVIALKRT